MNSTQNEGDLKAVNHDVLCSGCDTEKHGGCRITKIKESKDFQELVDQRMVATHDSHGIPLMMGNRAFRRSHIKNQGTSKPKQFHKQGH